MKLRLFSALVALILAATAQATTFKALSDRELIASADAVVVGTVGDVTGRIDGAMIVSDAQLRVEEVLKGSVATSQTITITEAGGSANGMTMMVVDGATYEKGQRLLVFLKKTESGSWFTKAMARGRFEFGRNMAGEAVLIRESHGERDGSRLQNEFMDYIRQVASGRSDVPEAYWSSAVGAKRALVPVTDAVRDYALIGNGFPVRWPGCENPCTVTFSKTGSQPNWNTAFVDSAASAWTNVATANITIATNGSTPVTDPNLVLVENPPRNTIQFGYDGALNDQSLCDEAQACTVLTANTSPSFQHPYAGEQWLSILRAHVLFRTAIPNQQQFNALAVHELGHAIGIRHSNELGRNPNSSFALMTSPVNAGLGQTLQSWDIDAVSSLYGSGPPCNVPVVTNIRGGGTVASGQTATLIADVTGTSPFTYQWYRGNRGDRTQPVGTGQTFTTPPVTAPQTYWVLVTNSCGNVESNAVTVTPAACTGPVITSEPPASAAVTSGVPFTLTVAHTGTSPFTYQWYRGARPDTSDAVFGATSNSLTTSLTQTTSFWLRISNGCGTADTITFTRTVAGTCARPTLTVAPQSVAINSTRTVALVASAAGTAPLTYNWFRGGVSDRSSPQPGRNTVDNERWLAMVFADLLRQTIDPGTSASLRAQLDAGASRASIVRSLIGSDAYRAALISNLYETYLRRGIGNEERDFWVASLRSGTPDEAALAALLSSTEFYVLAGGTPSTWVSLLYNNILGREPSGGELADAVNALNGGTPRQALAGDLLSSSAARSRVVAALYQRFLRRGASDGEVAALVSAISGGSFTPAIAALLASDEYFSFGSVLIVDSVSGNASYWVEATNSCGDARSGATISFNQCVAPAIAAQPSNTSINVGGNFALGFALLGTPATAVQWYEGERLDVSRPVAGATSPVFLGTRTIPGSYRFWARASNGCGTVDTNAATVVVNCGVEKPAISTRSTSVEKNSGFRVALPSVPGVTYAFRGTNATATRCSTSEFCVTPTPDFVGIVTVNIDATITCPGGPQTATSTIDVSIVEPAAPSAPQFTLATPPCSTSSCQVIQKLFISGDAPAAGKGALGVTTTFSLSADRPWVSFSPQSGILPPAGITVDVICEAAGLEGGTTSAATITITKTTTDSAGVGIAASNTTTKPISVSLVAPVSQAPKGSNPPPQSLIIPAVANADGANLSKFLSDVRISNNSNSVQNYLISFTPAGQNGTANGRQFSLSINANDSKALDNVVKNWFGLGTGSVSGAMEIRPVSNSVGGGGLPSQNLTVASSRTYNSTALGTFGQYVPALPLSTFLAKLDTKISLQQITQSSSVNSFRTNVGLVEGSGQPASLELRLLDRLNQQVASTTVQLQAFEQRQVSIPALFNNATITDGRVEIRVTSDTGKVTAYASVLDNATSDPILILPVRPGATQSRRYVVPGVAELNFTPERNFRTDLRIYNGGSEPEAITLAYTTTDRTPPAPVQMMLAPGEVKVIDDTLRSLWGISNSGGAVIITTNDDSSLVVTGRTFTRRPEGGTFGQFIPGVTPEEGAGSGESAKWVLQMEESSNFRSNLGLIELTGQPATIRVRYYSADSKVSGSLLDFTMQGSEFRQIGSILKPLGNVYNGRISIEVIGGSGRVAAYGANIDNRTSDPTYVPAQ